MNPELIFYLQLLVVLGADLLFGDPRWRLHPVRLIGWLCNFYETLSRHRLSWFSLKMQGALAFFLVLFTTLMATYLCFYLVRPFGGIATAGCGVVIIYFGIAAGDLIKHSSAVKRFLDQNDIVGARRAVAMMVGRDTAELDTTEISRACVESVSENIVDGVTAPLFWAFVFSLIGSGLSVEPLTCAAFGVIGYKAVNTMDSMFGYKNERYLEFGRLAARFDDVCNFFPARLTGICLVGAAFLPGFNGPGAARVFFDDRLKSSSPNSGHSEAATAGALGVMLGGGSDYFGQAVAKPIIGGRLTGAGADDIHRANRLNVAGVLIFFVASCLAHYFVSRFL